MSTPAQHKYTLQQLAVALGYVAVAVLTLLPFFRIGFANIDDLEYFVTAHQSWSQWAADHQHYAQYSGRFYFLITKYFYYVPYLIDSFAYTKAVQYLTLVGCYGLFAHLVGRIMGSRQLALMVMLLLLFNTTVTPNFYFMANINYPFFFTFSLIVFMAGVLLYVNYVQRGGRWRLWLMGGVLFAACLFYEVYVLLTALVAAVIVLRHCVLSGLKPALRNRATWLEALPAVVAVVLYMVCYVGYRQWLATHVPESAAYSGTQLATTFSVSNFVNVLLNLTAVNLPGMVYHQTHDQLALNSLLMSGHRSGLQLVLGHASATVWLCALLQGGLLWWLSGRRGWRSLSWRRLAFGAAAAAVLALAVHVPLALTEKYNSEWSEVLHCYVTSFFSYFGVMLVIALAVAASLKAATLTKWHTPLRVAWSLLLVFGAVVTGYGNEHLGREWQRSQNRFAMIDLMGQQNYFDTMPENAILYVEDYDRCAPREFMLAVDYSRNLLEKYISLRANRHVTCATSMAKLNQLAQADPSAPIYYTGTASTLRCEMVLTMARLDSLPTPGGVMTASRADVFYLSPCKDFTVVYTDATGTHSVRHTAPAGCRLPHLDLSATALDPTSVMVSNMTINPETPILQ